MVTLPIDRYGPYTTLFNFNHTRIVDGVLTGDGLARVLHTLCLPRPLALALALALHLPLPLPLPLPLFLPLLLLL